MTGFAFLLFGITFMYWNFRPDVSFLQTKQDVVFNPIWRTAFYIHIFGGMLAIVLGPLQFIKWLRSNNLVLHRIIGKIYVSAILFVAAPTGLYMAFYANGGVYSSIGFILMSALWFYTTLMAIVTIRKKKVSEHIKWMVRSYAMTFAAVTLRLWVPFLSLVINMEEMSVIIITAWISWLFNLIAAEFILKMNLKNLKP
jgi:uncharacterized membrane protein